LATAALRVLSKNLARASKMLRSRLANATRPANAELQPAYARNTPNCQPIHPLAQLRQVKRVGNTYAHFNASVRRYLSTGSHNSSAVPRFDRSKLPVSNTSRAVSRFTGRAPFACTLRPNLSGGTLGRTAGGYSIGGGSARYFSHTPVAQAQVVSNVSQAMRAFWLGGHRARYDGVDANGKVHYRAVNAAQEEARIRLASVPSNAPGSFIDFRVSPTITALSPLGVVFPFAATMEQGFKPMAGETATLHAEGFLDVLSVDFARALQDLAAIMTDLKSLAVLGNLPITLEKGSVLRVRFPGVDAETVERLCDDAGVRRGVVRQDAAFEASVGVPVALQFPFAPDEDCTKTITSPGGSLRSQNSGGTEIEEMFFDEYEENPWLSPPEAEGYESMSPDALSSSGEHCSEDFEGLEGIYRFIEECDRARARV